MIFVALNTLQSISAQTILCAVYTSSGVAGGKEMRLSTVTQNALTSVLFHSDKKWGKNKMKKKSVGMMYTILKMMVTILSLFYIY